MVKSGQITICLAAIPIFIYIYNIYNMFPADFDSCGISTSPPLVQEVLPKEITKDLDHKVGSDRRPQVSPGMEV
jgi:hypothetical protein